jgi:ABC-type glutathione transport system ATPase component
MTETVPVLEAVKITKRYSRKNLVTEAVTDISFRLYKGEILGIVGESGCGKSTLLRQLACLEKPTSGRILMNGEDITNKRPIDICRKLQMIFQNPVASFDPRMKLYDSICEAVQNMSSIRGKEASKRTDDLIRMVGLTPSIAERYPSDISGGQCQRLAIARSIAAGPSALLCDEVTSALDVSAQAQIANLLSELRKNLGLSIIFVSHDLALVSVLCDRIIVMQNGIAVEEGGAKEILSNPENEYTRLLIDSVR